MDSAHRGNASLRRDERFEEPVAEWPAAGQDAGGHHDSGRDFVHSQPSTGGHHWMGIPGSRIAPSKAQCSERRSGGFGLSRGTYDFQRDFLPCMGHRGLCSGGVRVVPLEPNYAWGTVDEAIGNGCHQLSCTWIVGSSRTRARSVLPLSG
jgi:hypothetical protein